MHPHSYPSPPRILAAGGPVSAAIRTMREANELTPLLAEQFDREAVEIHTLRLTIQRQLEADFDRIDRCLVILDTLGGDADFEENGDCEPSLCGVSSLNLHGLLPGEGGDDREADAGDEAEHVNEDGGDINDEPHDAEQDKGAEEDEGPTGYYHRDRDMAAMARAARVDLDDVLSRRRKSAPTTGSLRMVNVGGRDAVLVTGRTVY